jgi:hypothetical protein
MPTVNDTYQPIVWTTDSLVPSMTAYPHDAKEVYFYNQYSRKQTATEYKTHKTGNDSLARSTVKESTTVEETGRQSDAFQADWILLSLLAVLFFFGWLRVTYARRTGQVLKAAFNYQQSYDFFRERNYTTVRVSFSLNLLFVVNTGFYLYLLSKHLGFSLPLAEPYYNWLALSGAAAVFSLSFYILLKMAALFTGAYQAFNEYIHHTFVYLKNAGVYVLPVIVSIPYLPDPWPGHVIHLGWIVFAFFWLMKLIRGIKLCFLQRLSILYMFLYLCTLEIAPLLVTYKLISTFTSL